MKQELELVALEDTIPFDCKRVVVSANYVSALLWAAFCDAAAQSGGMNPELLQERERGNAPSNPRALRDMIENLPYITGEDGPGANSLGIEAQGTNGHGPNWAAVAYQSVTGTVVDFKIEVVRHNLDSDTIEMTLEIEGEPDAVWRRLRAIKSFPGMETYVAVTYPDEGEVKIQIYQEGKFEVR